MVSDIALGSPADRAKDILGRVYEYFLSQFATAEGKKAGSICMIAGRANRRALLFAELRQKYHIEQVPNGSRQRSSPGRQRMAGKAPKARILVVDDDVNNITILREILGPRYTVLSATTGNKAVALAASNPPPDLILLDIKMPNMDGFDVLKTLKTSQRTRNIKIVFVTAKRGIDDKMTAYEKGIEDYITKPIDAQFVLQIVERLTGKAGPSGE